MEPAVRVLYVHTRPLGFQHADTWQLYPAHCQVPDATEQDKTLLTATNLLEQLGCMILAMASAKLKHLAAIRQISTIMSGKLNSPPPLPTSLRVETAPPPRVATAAPPRVATTPNTITTPFTICWLPIVHQHLQQHNNPIQILPDNDDHNDDDTVVASNCSPQHPFLPYMITISLMPLQPPLQGHQHNTRNCSKRQTNHHVHPLTSDRLVET